MLFETLTRQTTWMDSVKYTRHEVVGHWEKDEKKLEEVLKEALPEIGMRQEQVGTDPKKLIGLIGDIKEGYPITDAANLTECAIQRILVYSVQTAYILGNAMDNRGMDKAELEGLGEAYRTIEKLYSQTRRWAKEHTRELLEPYESEGFGRLRDLVSTMRSHADELYAVVENLDHRDPKKLAMHDAMNAIAGFWNAERMLNELDKKYERVKPSK